MHITEICLECESRTVRELNETEQSNPDYFTHVRSITVDECSQCSQVPDEDSIWDDDD